MEHAPLTARAVDSAAHWLTDEFTAEHPTAPDAPTLEDTRRLVADAAARLRAVCGHLADDAFAVLVVDVVRVKLRDKVRDGLGAASEHVDRTVLERLARDPGPSRAD